jgi:hypothetical protein
MRGLLLIALFLSGCADLQLPPSPADIQAKKFEAVPGTSVIYIVRNAMDSNETSGLSLDDRAQITTFRRSYYRWEVAPGTHRIAGIGRANEVVTLTTAPGKIYFLEHNVQGNPRMGATFTSLRQIDEQQGRALVLRSQLTM